MKNIVEEGGCNRQETRRRSSIPMFLPVAAIFLWRFRIRLRLSMTRLKQPSCASCVGIHMTRTPFPLYYFTFVSRVLSILFCPFLSLSCSTCAEWRHDLSHLVFIAYVLVISVRIQWCLYEHFLDIFFCTVLLLPVVSWMARPFRKRFLFLPSYVLDLPPPPSLCFVSKGCNFMLTFPV